MYRLLIVEDDMGIAEAIRARAASWELESRIVTNFRDVMQEFGEYDPQLVLLDITLPFYSGYYWCERIRKISIVTGMRSSGRRCGNSPENSLPVA